MPTITKGSRVAILCALLLLVLAVACAPVAPPESPSGDDPNEQAEKTESDGSGDEKPTATPKPTRPPEPTPKPDRDSDGKPEPTRHPDDPPSPTTEPTSTPGPITPASAPVDPMPPHPDGMAGCYSMNLYQMSVDEVPFMFWCQRVLSEDVAQNCQGAGDGTTEDEKKCGIQLLADVQVFMMRGVRRTLFRHHHFIRPYPMRGRYRGSHERPLPSPSGRICRNLESRNGQQRGENPRLGDG